MIYLFKFPMFPFPEESATMKLRDLIADPEKIPPYRPADHAATTNRKLIGGKEVPSAKMELILGELAPGGEALWHAHPHSEQIIYVLEGSCSVQALGEEEILYKGMAILFPQGLEHRVVVMGEETLRCLIIYAPPIDRANY